MSAFTLSDLFTYSDTDAALTVADEVLLIEAAQAGDGDAYVRLLTAYGRTLRKTSGKAAKILGDEEAQAVAMVAFAEVLSSHDPHDENYADGRLAARLTPHLKDRLSEAIASANPFEVPKRTHVRFLGIMKEADGDVEAARALAPARQMTVETFDAVRAAIDTGSLSEGEEAEEGSARPSRIEGASPVFTPSPVVDVEDRLLVEAAFRAVDDEQHRIVSLFYGFTEYETVPDAEIGHRMGLTRPTVQRKRAKALDSMRKTLGVTHA
jgi:DNA-directed RNA polymerase specialized sigma24 family protein